jgi:inhibitor of cysteine peptidase
MNRRLRNFLRLAGVTALVGASLPHLTSAVLPATEKARTMQSLTEADNDKTVDLRVGETVRVSLPENATTGYRWAIDRLDEDVIEAVGSEPNYPGSAVGSAGHVAFTFKAKKAGTGEVTLKYWRHFEGDKSITNRFRLRLHTQQ